MAKHTQKQLQAIVKEVIANFESDGKTDYARMDEAIFASTGLRFDNKSIWGLVDRARKQIDRITFVLED